MMEVILT